MYTLAKITQAKMNWFGLTGATLIIVVIAASFFVPWWQLTAGEDIVKINVSPVNTNFNFVDSSFTVPIIWALNIASLLSLITGAVLLLIYSVAPTKSYSKHLLGFAYKKPLYAVIFSIIIPFLIILLVNNMFKLNVPLVGSAQTVLPTNLTYGSVISVHLTAEFLWPFYLAAFTAGICIAARLYHRKIVGSQTPISTTNVQSQQSTTTV